MDKKIKKKDILTRKIMDRRSMKKKKIENS